jgi:hypothetical protein
LRQVVRYCSLVAAFEDNFFFSVFWAFKLMVKLPFEIMTSNNESLMKSSNAFLQENNVENQMISVTIIRTTDAMKKEVSWFDDESFF